jgi:hypothetical protein
LCASLIRGESGGDDGLYMVYSISFTSSFVYCIYIVCNNLCASSIRGESGGDDGVFFSFFKTKIKVAAAERYKYYSDR